MRLMTAARGIVQRNIVTLPSWSLLRGPIDARRLLAACDLLLRGSCRSLSPRAGISKMRTILTAALASAALLPCAGGPIDFTPTSGERVLENVVFPQLVFHQH